MLHAAFADPGRHDPIDGHVPGTLRVSQPLVSRPARRDQSRPGAGRIGGDNQLPQPQPKWPGCLAVCQRLGCSGRTILMGFRVRVTLDDSPLVTRLSAGGRGECFLGFTVPVSRLRLGGLAARARPSRRDRRSCHMPISRSEGLGQRCRSMVPVPFTGRWRNRRPAAAALRYHHLRSSIIG